MTEQGTPPTRVDSVADDTIRAGQLPPPGTRDLPEPVALHKMIGPSIILAGLALGSGEFILWPKITFHIGFVFFWAAVVGVTLQYFINMEITRWTLATGESAITGFCRLSKHWAWIFLIFNIAPWCIPAWSTAAAQLLGWLIWPDAGGQIPGPYMVPLAIAGLVGCGVILTAGPVVYNTVEKIQLVMVGGIMLLVVFLASQVVTADAVGAMASGVTSFQIPDLSNTPQLTPVVLLGALAFAGAGGTLNLGQSNYVKDKGYGMGYYIGRITSPVTGQAEAMAEIGYHFPHTPENLSRWRTWWRRASVEHFFSFFVTCVVCLALLALITYSLFFHNGERMAAADAFDSNLAFIWGQAVALGANYHTLFLWIGVAILFTTELCVLDATSRISADIVKVNWLRSNENWTESRLYSVFLWMMIALGTLLLLVAGSEVGGFTLVKISAALNGGVMCFYCVTLVILNRTVLPTPIRTPIWRAVIIAAAALFFGCFAAWALYVKVAG